METGSARGSGLVYERERGLLPRDINTTGTPQNSPDDNAATKGKATPAHDVHTKLLTQRTDAMTVETIRNRPARRRRKGGLARSRGRTAVKTMVHATQYVPLKSANAS